MARNKVTEQSVDEALLDVTERRRKARQDGDTVADMVLTKQIDRLLEMRHARVSAPPMIHR